MTEAIHWYKASCDSQNEVFNLLTEINDKLNPIITIDFNPHSGLNSTMSVTGNWHGQINLA